MPFFLFLFFSSCLLASAATFTVSEAQEQARRHHPAFVAARLRVEEARARLLGAGRFKNPELEISSSTNTTGKGSKWEVALAQSFPLTARLRLERRLSREQIELAQWEIAEMERQLRLEVGQNAVRLLAIREQIAFHREQQRLLESLSEYANAAAQKGELPVTDAGSFRLEALGVDATRRALEAEEKGLTATLREQLGLSPSAQTDIRGKLPPLSLPPRPRQANERPELRKAVAQEKSAQTEVALAKSRRWEEIEVAATYERERDEEESEHFIGVRVGIPLPLWNRNEGEIAEKSAAAARARLETATRRHEITHEIATTHEAMAALRDQAAQSREQLLPLAREQVRLLEEAYRKGEATLPALLDARRRTLSLELTVLETVRDFHLARLRFEAATYRSTRR